MSFYFLGNGVVTSSRKPPNFAEHLAETHVVLLFLKKSQLLSCGWKKQSLSIGYSINSLYKPDTVWWGIWTASRSLKAFTSLLGAVHNMDGFTGASMDQSADPHSAPEPGGFVSCSQGNQASLHFNTFACFFWQATGLCRPVKAGNGSYFQGVHTALCEQSFSVCKTISKRC